MTLRLIVGLNSYFSSSWHEIYVDPFTWDCLSHIVIAFFYFYGVFSAGLSSFMVRKTIKLAVNINLAAVKLLVDKRHLRLT